MQNSKNPRTDALELSLTTWTIDDLNKSMAHARELEQELSEARLKSADRNDWQEVAMKVSAERDQLRKVCDELAGTIYVHSLRPQNALDTYNQLPHVERKTK